MSCADVKYRTGERSNAVFYIDGPNLQSLQVSEINTTVYFTGDDNDMTDADSPTARVAYLAGMETAA